jgi:hypothetical protein
LGVYLVFAEEVGWELGKDLEMVSVQVYWVITAVGADDEPVWSGLGWVEVGIDAVVEHDRVAQARVFPGEMGGVDEITALELTVECAEE